MSVSLSPLDTQRFGIASARAEISDPSEIEGIDAFCKAQGVKLLIARCSTDHISTAQHMEETGYRLMDTLVRMRFDCSRKLVASDASRYIVRGITSEDGATIQDIAKDAFKRYTASHYYNDPALEKDKCMELYVDWAYQSALAEDELHHSFIAEDTAGKAAGFVCTHEKDKELEAHLVGVRDANRRQGVGSALYRHAVNVAINRNKSYVTTSTQITNKASIGMWSRIGFEMYHAEYTFHKWYD